MTNTLPGRPANPSEISFDRRCFKAAGARTVYKVSTALQSGPINFGEDLVAATAYARRTNREVRAVQETVWRRISWR